MNKKELINKISYNTGVNKTQTGKILNTLLDIIKKSVSKGDLVQLIGFGSFVSGKRESRIGRNPKTGESIKIPSYKVIKFTAGKKFKDIVNNSE